MLEKYSLFIILAGVLIMLIGGLWLVIAAFRVRKGWGFAVLLIPFAGAVFAVVHFRRAWFALLLMFLGLAFAVGTFAYNKYTQHHIDLGPREDTAMWVVVPDETLDRLESEGVPKESLDKFRDRTFVDKESVVNAVLAYKMKDHKDTILNELQEVEGGKRINLKDWDREDYSFLKGEAYKDTVWLNISNNDVTDDTLEYIKEMKKLRILELNDTAVTDKGLEIIKSFQDLEILRLKKTKITDEGFQNHLQGMKSLMKIELTGVEGVKMPTVRKWKNENKEREYLKN